MLAVDVFLQYKDINKWGSQAVHDHWCKIYALDNQTFVEILG